MLYIAGFEISAESTAYFFQQNGDDPIVLSYRAAPLLGLQEIIDSGLIPVLDTSGCMGRIVDRNPELRVTARFVFELVRKNYLLHESAHCICYRLLSPLLLDRDCRDKRRYVLVSMLCESFANAVERVAAFGAADDVHRLMFGMNSYVYCPDTILKDCVNRLGLEQTIYLAVVAFFRINCRRTWPECDVRSLVELERQRSRDEASAFLSGVLIERFRSDLSPGFVGNTTPLFFGYVGCGGEYQSLIQGELFRGEQEESEFLGSIDALARLSRIESIAGPDKLPKDIAVAGSAAGACSGGA